MASTPTHVTGAGRVLAAAAPLATGCSLFVGAAYVAAVDPAGGGWWLPCPLHAVTGWWCPGCGMTRATHHLLHGDLPTALRFNVLVVPVLALIVSCWALWLTATVGVAPRRLRRIPSWAYGVAIFTAVAFAVLRNVPGVDGLRG